MLLFWKHWMLEKMSECVTGSLMLLREDSLFTMILVYFLLFMSIIQVPVFFFVKSIVCLFIGGCYGMVSDSRFEAGCNWDWACYFELLLLSLSVCGMGMKTVIKKGSLPCFWRCQFHCSPNNYAGGLSGFAECASTSSVACDQRKNVSVVAERTGDERPFR